MPEGLLGGVDRPPYLDDYFDWLMIDIDLPEEHAPAIQNELDAFEEKGGVGPECLLFALILFLLTYPGYAISKWVSNR